jgi:hypothetical protein
MPKENRALNNQTNSPVCEQPTEETKRREQVISAARQKKQFIEPMVSVPVDVLEATNYFAQLTTVAATNTGP